MNKISTLIKNLEKREEITKSMFLYFTNLHNAVAYILGYKKQ